MADPYVRSVGQVEDIDGTPLAVGVDYDTVTLGQLHHLPVQWRLDRAQAEQFARLFTAACWEAGAQMGEETSEADGGSTMDTGHSGILAQDAAVVAATISSADLGNLTYDERDAIGRAAELLRQVAGG